MAVGIRLVGSERTLEGLSVGGMGAPSRALIANTPEEYVQGIVQLFENPQLRHDLSTNTRQMIKTEFTWKGAGKLYEQVCLTPKDAGEERNREAKGE
ncbi:Glycosyl transferase, group 1 [Richelia intracellularis]|nr:Glycosyl transferase, group 1 [Richelia intracellularis]